MRLEAKEVKKRTEEMGGWEAESPLEMCEKNDPFAGLRGRDMLLAG